jgi:outer membrane receptor protein involved in Fe transport
LNYTYVDSKFAIRANQSSSLPSTSKDTLNASVSYEKNGLNLRLAGYYLSRNLFAIGGVNGPDTFAAPRLSVDFGSSYAVNKHVSMYFNAKNLTNTAMVFYEGNSNRVIQREFYGATYQVGVNLTY